MSSNPGFQIECRCRVRGLVGESLHSMPRRTRSRAVAALLAAAAEGIDLHLLIAAREQLRAAGVLVNQRLRYSFKLGQPDPELRTRIVTVLGIVEAIVQSGEDVP